MSTLVRCRRADGFSLIEVIVASALLTVGLIAAVQLLMRSAATNASARTLTQATVLAIDKMEQLRVRAIDDPVLERSPPGTLTSEIDGYFDRPAESYVRRWSIEPLPSFPDEGVVVRVIVTRAASVGTTFVETIKVRKPTGCGTRGTGCAASP